MQDGSRVLVRRCPRCVRQLPLSEFHRRSRETGKLSSYCSDCVREVTAARRALRRRAYDERSVADFRDALANGKPVNFGALTRAARRELLRTLDVGAATAAEIAKRVGCSTVTVYRHRRLRGE